MFRRALPGIGLLIAMNLLFSSGAPGQEYTPDDNDLGPVSKGVAALVRSDAAWRKCGACQKCDVAGKAIDLAKSGAKDTTFATMAKECGCENGVCPLWIVRDGKVLLSDGGASLVVGRTSRKGLPDLVTDSSTSARESNLNRLPQFGPANTPQAECADIQRAATNTPASATVSSKVRVSAALLR